MSSITNNGGNRLSMMLLLVFCVTSVFGIYHLPPGVKLCHRSQPDFSKCLKKTVPEALVLFAKGSKELGVPRIEPLFIKKLEMPASVSRSGTIEHKYSDVNIHGISRTTVASLKINFDDKNCGWVFNFLSESIQMVGDYELTGQLLVFPLNGKGKCNITQVNLHNEQTMKCEKYTKDGKTYLKATNYSMVMRPENVIYNFTNLIPGNPQISEQVLKTLNEDPLTIFNEFRAVFEDVFSQMYLQACNQVFSKIPLDDLFLK